MVKKMTKLSLLKKSFGLAAATLGALAVMGAASGAAAHALQPGQCYTRDVFNQTITNEGMRTLVVGNRTGIREDASSPTGARGVDFINGVAANLTNGEGYLFQGDQPRGTPANRICISAALANTLLNDINSPAIPRSAYLGGRFDNGVDAKAERGERPMIVANTVFGTGATRRNGLPLVLFGNAADRTGAITSMATDGQPTLLGALHSLEYTPFALEQLASQSRQVASAASSTTVAALQR